MPFVLFVDLHCVGCAKKIERSILKIRGHLLFSTIFIRNKPYKLIAFSYTEFDYLQELREW